MPSDCLIPSSSESIFSPQSRWTYQSSLLSEEPFWAPKPSFISSEKLSFKLLVASGSGQQWLGQCSKGSGGEGWGEFTHMAYWVKERQLR